MKVLVTGVAGFIGMHVAQALLARGDEVVGIDNLNDYYSPALKQARLDKLGVCPDFRFELVDLADSPRMQALFAAHRFDRVVHLGAQAGVRYSLINPLAYANSNLLGFTNVLEGCRHHQIEHLVFASSSSVYGANEKVPFNEHDPVDHPISLYAATKKANELMAHSYAHLFGIPCSGLRFFTVYGPWGRPDMAIWLFTDAILNNQPIKVFNHGDLQRDFTYIDDIVEGVLRVLDRTATPNPLFDRHHPDPATSFSPFRLYNIGNHQPVQLEAFISTLESALGKTAIKHYLPMQPGDVHATYADIERLQEAVSFTPATSLEAGVGNFVSWYRSYHQL